MNARRDTFPARLWKRYIPLTIGIVYILFPFYWTISTSLKEEREIFVKPLRYLPSVLSFQNFSLAWQRAGFSIYFKNSLIVALGGMLCILVVGIMSGYALSRFKFKGKRLFMMILLCTQFFPGAMLLIPLFMIFRDVGLSSTLSSLIITYTLFEFPFIAILMRGFISNLPTELEEAAWVDGCTRVSAIFRILVPVLLPCIVAAGAIGFIGCWNEFMFGLMLVNDMEKFTIPVGLSYLKGQFEINYGIQAAGALIAILPALGMFAYVQRYLVSGLSSGSVKG